QPFVAFSRGGVPPQEAVDARPVLVADPHVLQIDWLPRPAGKPVPGQSYPTVENGEFKEPPAPFGTAKRRVGQVFGERFRSFRGHTNLLLGPRMSLREQASDGPEEGCAMDVSPGPFVRVLEQ